MSNILYADPDLEVSTMCHKNHVDRAPLYEQGIMDAEYEPVTAKSGPVIHIVGASQSVPGDCHVALQGNAPRNDSKNAAPSIHQVKRVLGAMGRWGAGAVFLCGVADGLIDTTYGLMLTIICTGWGLLHLLQGVAHG